MQPDSSETTQPDAGLREVSLVARRVAESANVSSFYLSSPNGKPLPSFTAGQYILIHAPGGGTAPYFLSAYARVPRSYRFTVLRQPAEPQDLSHFLLDEFVSGGLLTVSGPFGSFALPADARRPIIIVSRGIGSAVATTLGDELAQKPRPPIHFVHVEQHETDPILFGTKFRSLCAEMKDASFTLLTQDMMQGDGIASALLAPETSDQSGETPLYVLCGAEAFVQPVSLALRNHGVPPASIETLSFGAWKTEFDAPVQRPIEPIDLVPRVVTLSRSGKTAVWTEADGTLLDFALALGAALPFTCRTGMCGACAQRLISGEVLPIREIAAKHVEAGNILLCSCVPVSDIILDV